MNRLKIESLSSPQRIKNLGQTAASSESGKTGRNRESQLTGSRRSEAKSVTGAVLVEPFLL